MNGAGASSELSLPPLQPKSATAATATKPDVISERHQRLLALAAMVFLLECSLFSAARDARDPDVPAAWASMPANGLQNPERRVAFNEKTPAEGVLPGYAITLFSSSALNVDRRRGS